MAPTSTGPEVPAHRTRTVKALSHEAGFDLVRIAAAGDLHIERSRYLDWIRGERHGQMRWIDVAHAVRSASPRSGLPEARSVVSVGLAYRRGPRRVRGAHRGAIARYAWGRDYHEVIGEMLTSLAQRLAVEFGGEQRWHVDTGPVMDKALAARAGLGWYGKNTNILTERFGSFVLLGEIVTSLELEPDDPLSRDCGACRLCVVACPTGALAPDYSIDSRKCISYLTIEHRGPIPRELRGLMGAWVFGCDICQDVCPPTIEPYLAGDGDREAWTASVRRLVAGDAGEVGSDFGRHDPASGDAPLSSDDMKQDVDLCWLLRLNSEDYLEAFRGSAIRRAKVWMLRRNAAVALGNVGDAHAIDPLAQSMSSDEEPIVRGHAAWAIGHLGQRLRLDVSDILRPRERVESDESVLDEIREAIRAISSPTP